MYKHYLSPFSYFLLEGSYLVPADMYCQVKGCSRPDLLAFQMSSGLAILFCGVFGFRTWHVSRRVHSVIPPTPEGRLFAFLPESDQLAAANFTFQIWDFFVSLLIEEHRTPM